MQAGLLLLQPQSLVKLIKTNYGHRNHSRRVRIIQLCLLPDPSINTWTHNQSLHQYLNTWHKNNYCINTWLITASISKHTYNHCIYTWIQFTCLTVKISQPINIFLSSWVVVGQQMRPQVHARSLNPVTSLWVRWFSNQLASESSLHSLFEDDRILFCHGLAVIMYKYLRMVNACFKATGQESAVDMIIFSIYKLIPREWNKNWSTVHLVQLLTPVVICTPPKGINELTHLCVDWPRLSSAEHYWHLEAVKPEFHCQTEAFWAQNCF